jgi:cold shock CspA family protein
MNMIDMPVRQPRERNEDLPWQKGTIKWFDENGRRFGFIIPEVGESDVFFSWQVLRNCNIKEARVVEDAPVEYKAVPPDRPNRRPRAVAMRML